MEIYTVKYSELTKDQFFEILKLRIKIFVVEQNCPYQELDQFDLIANHVYGLIDGKVMAVGRIYQKMIYYVLEELPLKNSIEKMIMREN